MFIATLLLKVNVHFDLSEKAQFEWNNLTLFFSIIVVLGLLIAVRPILAKINTKHLFSFYLLSIYLGIKT
ncbi:hypothetical protein [Melissococcus plutonius]|uniref:Uncharacterized protein n=1 Tax=Melissococcus plutonius (strain ATCC 35311 / DSM 29964 / CIP 104052 / LMG 20360 / NCIMB 702443) TaxID=940190 RepID=F3Y8W4_MELPT|nr:hypothetical protein [Melissococcus plutonius]AIM25590.1 hypothetical protein MEPL_c004070 [Melissococcus plutonius S1]KMT24651.1 hypothetical protein MEPL2_2c01530 [Melissococcus plutonius]KMT27364.1 hypothetical protein MEPL3_1c04350 [Melissococcus plutonius]KMT27537.1 hypothetical protein MEPL1_3c01460 [Melissococcus plutonius]KMT29311.1 hypothetical protein MEPL4_3c01450 [Melissococcus plutonius]